MLIDDLGKERLNWVLDKLQDRPLYKSFSNPVVYKPKGVSDRTEISIESIRQGLSDGEIATIPEFQSQMKLWFQLKGARQPYIYKLALGELQRLYNKYYGYAEASLNRDLWNRRVVRRHIELEQLCKNAPECVVFPVEQKPLDKDQLQFAIRAIQKVTAPMDVYKVYEILKKDPLAVDLTQENVTVPLDKLLPASQHEIYDFLFEKFPQQQAVTPGRSKKK